MKKTLLVLASIAIVALYACAPKAAPADDVTEDTTAVVEEMDTTIVDTTVAEAPVEEVQE